MLAITMYTVYLMDRIYAAIYCESKNDYMQLALHWNLQRFEGFKSFHNTDSKVKV